MSSRLIAVVVTCGFLGGCAGYSLTPVNPNELDALWNTPGGGREGYIIYEPEPILIGTLQHKEKDAKGVPIGQYDFVLEYLPNRDRPYRFTRYEFLAKSELDISFEHGWQLVGAKSSTDSTALPAALIDLAKDLLAMDSHTPAEAPLPPVVMFRIVTSKDGLRLERIDAPIAQPAPAPGAKQAP